jgi:hypothetical protein
MGDKVNQKAKSELYAMLAEAVRNTQPQPPVEVTQPDSILKAQSKPTRKPGRVSKRTTKTKNARASAARKGRRR